MRPKTVRETPRSKRRLNALPMMCSASRISPRPRAMELSGAPPLPHRLANPMMMVIIGRAIPMPVKASRPSAIWPIYIRSTMLYRMLISWATAIGDGQPQDSLWNTALGKNRFAAGRAPVRARFYATGLAPAPVSHYATDLVYARIYAIDIAYALARVAGVPGSAFRYSMRRPLSVTIYIK